MKALLCTRYGPPDKLELGDIDEPQAGAGEAVVKVQAVGLSFFDTLIIAGKYQFKPAPPFSPGAELAGVVEAVGAGVAAVKPGQRVVAYVTHGAARERIAIAADKLMRMPDDLDFDRAAGIVVTYYTALLALKDRAALKPGETLVVLGAAGGIGLAAVELGKIIGARVIACASSDEKLAFARAHGADEVVNYSVEDLRDALRRITGGHGADVICDPVGGAYTEAALRAIAWKGRLAVIGFASGHIPQLPLNLVLLKGCDVQGVFFLAIDGARPAAPPRRYRAASWVVRGGEAVVPRTHGLPAGRGCGGAQGHSGAPGHGQGNPTALAWISQTSMRCAAAICRQG
jgi:NADPH2:quinone reductase